VATNCHNHRGKGSSDGNKPLWYLRALWSNTAAPKAKTSRLRSQFRSRYLAKTILQLFDFRPDYLFKTIPVGHCRPRRESIAQRLLAPLPLIGNAFFIVRFYFCNCARVILDADISNGTLLTLLRARGISDQNEYQREKHAHAGPNLQSPRANLHDFRRPTKQRTIDTISV